MQKASKNLYKITIVSLLIAYIANIINTLLSNTNFTELLDKASFIELVVNNELISKIEQFAVILNNGIEIFKVIIVGTMCLQLFILIFLNSLSNLIYKKLQKNESLFLYIASLGMNGYLIYYLLMNFSMKSGVIGSLIPVALLINIIVVTYLLIRTLKPAIKFFEAYFKALDYQKLAEDLLKLAAILIIIISGVILITKLSIYIFVAMMIKQIDLASLINLSDYVNIDLKSIIPQEYSQYKQVLDQSVAITADRAFDTYILDNLSALLHNLLIKFEGKLVLNNILIYIVSLVAGCSLIVIPRKQIGNKNYLIAIIACGLAILLFVYTNSMILLLAACLLLLGAGIVILKEVI